MGRLLPNLSESPKTRKPVGCIYIEKKHIQLLLLHCNDVNTFSYRLKKRKSISLKEQKEEAHCVKIISQDLVQGVILRFFSTEDWQNAEEKFKGSVSPERLL